VRLAIIIDELKRLAIAQMQITTEQTIIIIEEQAQ